MAFEIGDRVVHTIRGKDMTGVVTATPSSPPSDHRSSWASGVYWVTYDDTPTNGWRASAQTLWTSAEEFEKSARKEETVTPVLNETTVADLVNGLLGQGLDPDTIRDQVSAELEARRDYWDGFRAGQAAKAQELTGGYETSELRKVHRVSYNGESRDVTVIGISAPARGGDPCPNILVLEHAKNGTPHDEPRVRTYKPLSLYYVADVTSEYGENG